MKQGDVIATLSLSGTFSWACWCDRAMDFQMGVAARHLCDCGAIWAWDGSGVERRPSGRRAALDAEGEILYDEHGEIVWEWAEMDKRGQWIDGRR